MNDEHTGACLCGSVRFKTHGALREVVACHCSQCRKQTGFYYAATNVPLDNITIEGEDAITWYRASSFCPPRLLPNLRFGAFSGWLMAPGKSRSWPGFSINPAT